MQKTISTRLANIIQSPISMVVFCLIATVADIFIFTTGYKENDRIAFTAMETNIAAIIKVSKATGVSASTVSNYIMTPIQNEVMPEVTIVVGDSGANCTNEIDDQDNYVVECPLRDRATVRASASRTKVMEPVWRDITIAASTTIPGFTFLILFALISARRRQRLIRSNDDLDSRNHQLEAVFFSIHHDLVGPMDSISFSLDLIRDTVTPEQIENVGLTDAIDMIDQGISAQKLIVSGLREWLGASNLNRRDFKQTSIADLIERLKQITPYEGKIEIGSLPTINVIPDAFSIALDNLLRNSFHYNSKPIRLTKIYQQKGSIVIEDNGDGFDDHDFDKLTQPFQRGFSAKSGSGLGLAITRSIIESHGFKLRATSVIDEGSKFYIDFSSQG